MEAEGINNIVMLFGSARSKTPAAYRAHVEELRQKVVSDPTVKPQLVRAERMEFLCRYHEETVKLARLITEFSDARKKEGLPTYTVGTGAGPGMMEAANEGAYRAGGKSVGFGISLPFEKGLNPYVTPELGFEFHYFFTRKFWMAYKCMGLVVAPGGYGTADELFEILTLMQTDKIKRRLPVILFGEEYWKQVLNFAAMEEYGLLGCDWRTLIHTCDSAEEAFNHLKEYWLAQEGTGAQMSPKRRPVYTDGVSIKRIKLSDDGQPLPEGVPERPMPPKAYKNFDYIKSSHCRVFRIQCEFEETRHRLEAKGIENTLMFFGSGSVKSYEDHLRAVNSAHQENNQAVLARLSQQQPLLKYHEIARDLARRITAWSMNRRTQGKASYHVSTGGGPGLLESANEGAWEAGGRSLAFSGGAMGQSHFNRYVTPDLAFIFHYFFTRKFWMAYKCMGAVALPGGFGTCDELFELLTLMQTGKIKRKMPIVLVGKDFWQNVIHWQKMADYGMISDYDVTQLCFTDSAHEAFQYITSFWEKQEVDGKVPPSPSKKK
jgi:hypothetical protein